MPAARILIVEDEGLTAMELQRKLKSMGYDVPTFAFSGREAIIKAEELKPDLILMDIILKGQIDGITAAEEISKHQDIPIIYLTAHGDDNTRKRAGNTVSYAYLLKPFDEEELQKNIDQALYQHHLDKTMEKDPFLDKKIKKTGGAVIITDKDGIVQFMNYNASYITGWDKEEGIGKKIDEIFELHLKKTASISKNPVLDLLKNKTAEIKGRSWLKTISGSYVPIDYMIAPIKDSEVDIVGSTLIFKDITHVVDEEAIDNLIKKILRNSSPVSAFFDYKGNFIQGTTGFCGIMADDLEIDNFNLFRDMGMDDDLLLKLEKENSVSYSQTISSSSNSCLICKPQLDNKMEVKLTVSRYTDDSHNIDGFLLKLNKKEEKSSKITPEKHSVRVENTLKTSPELISNEDKLKAAQVMEYKFEPILNTINAVFFAIDRNFNCIYWNNYAENLTGVSRSQALGKSIYDIFTQLKGIEVEELYKTALKSQTPQSLIDEYPNSNGTRVYEINAYPSAGGVAVLIRDVSENKNVENDLKNEMNFFKSLLEKQKNLVCVMDKLGSIIFTNNSFKKLKNPSNFKYLLSLENKKEFEEKFLKKINPNNINLKNNPLKLSNSKINLNWDIVPLADSAPGKFMAVGSIAGNYQDEIEALNAKNRDLIKIQEDLQTELAQKKEKLEKAEKSGLEILQENQDLKNEIQEKIKSKKIDSYKLNLEINQLKIAKNDLKNELKQLKEETQNMAKIDENEPSSDLLIKELNEYNLNLKKNLENSVKQANKLSEDNKLLQRELAELEFIKSRNQKDSEEMKKEFNRQIGDFKGDIAQLKQINDSLLKEYTLLEKNSIKEQELLKNGHNILIEEQKNLKDSLQNLEIHVMALEKDNQNHEKDKKHYLNKLSQLKDIKKSLEENNLKIKEKSDKKSLEQDKKIKELNNKLETLKNQKSFLKNEKENLMKDIKNIQSLQQSLEIDNDNLKKSQRELLDKYSKIKESSKKSLNKLEKENEELKRSLNLINQEIKSIMVEKTEIIHNMEKNLEKLEKEKADNLSKLDSIMNEQDELKALFEEKNKLFDKERKSFENNLKSLKNILKLNSKIFREKLLEDIKEKQNQMEEAIIASEKLYNQSISYSNGSENLNTYLESIIGDFINKNHLKPDEFKIDIKINTINLNEDSWLTLGLILSEMLSLVIKKSPSRSGELKIIIAPYDKENRLDMITDLTLEAEHDAEFQIIKALSREIGGRLKIGTSSKKLFELYFPSKIF